jgi:two-component system, sensor histidine kinase and response regulator
MRAETATWSALIGALLLLGAVTLATWRSAVDLAPAIAEAERMQRVARAAGSMLSEYREAHSVRRAYLLTGSATFLQQYRERLRSARDDLQQVDSLTRSDPGQRPRIRRASMLMDRADSLGELTISVRTQQGLAAAAALVRTSGIQTLVDQVGDMLAEVQEVEQRRLAARLALVRQRAITANRIAIGSMMLAVILLPLAALIIREDLRKRQERNRQMRAASVAAQDATRAKSEFLASMSHEIRTPLNGVLGMIELLLDTDLTHAQRDYLVTARSSAESLLRLLNDILDFSKIEAGRLDLDVGPFALRDLVGDTLRSLGPRAEKKGLELAYRVAPAVPDVLIGDAGRMQQVIVNLVGNALKFTEHGEIVVGIDATPVNGGETELQVSVRDTGIGIAPDRLRAVFELFTQAESSTHRRFGGTGLGLSISERLVALMGGRIWVESELGQGSTFRFTARLRVGDQVAESRAELAQLEGVAVLVVDDHPTNRQILAEMLTQWRMRPVTTSTAGEGLRLARDARAAGTPFRLAILDFLLPDFTGDVLAERLVSSGAMPAGALVMLSSDSQPGDAARRAAAGISRSLMKPVKPSELLDALLTAAADGASPTAAAVQRGAPRWTGSRVLVAEDNPVNQQVARGLLERRGITVTIVDNGAAAVDVVQRDAGAFDLVLMDIEMPELDGLEATRRIRALPQRPGARRLPIVALTAHALAADRERAFTVGMDECLTKPVRSQDLDHVLSRYLGEPRDDAGWTGRGPTPPAEPPGRSVSARRPTREIVFDRMTTFLGDDPDLVAIIAREFVRQTPPLIAELRDAVVTGNATATAKIAHRLKGSAGQIAADDLARRAGALEDQAREGRLVGATDLLHEIEQEAAHLTLALESLATEGG